MDQKQKEIQAVFGYLKSKPCLTEHHLIFVNAILIQRLTNIHHLSPVFPCFIHHSHYPRLLAVFSHQILFLVFTMKVTGYVTLLSTLLVVAQAAVIPVPRPTLAKMKAAYAPVSYTTRHDYREVKKFLGGPIDVEWTGVNMCTVRMSHGLNGAGVKLPLRDENPLTVESADGTPHALRVIELRAYLIDELRWKPDAEVNKPLNSPMDFSKLVGKKGILTIDWETQAHFAFWNGVVEDDAFSGSYLSYFDNASKVTFWKLPE